MRIVQLSSLSLACLLAACGGGGDSGTGAVTPPPPEPVFLPTPVPAGTWAPPAGSTPAKGNYVYLQSDPGDPVGNGKTLSYERSNANVTLESSGGQLRLRVDGDQIWDASLHAMRNLSQFQAGYYADLKLAPQHDQAKGGLTWSRDGKACSNASGWFAVDKVSYTQGQLDAIDLRFEQRCGDAGGALRGALHWQAQDAAPVPAEPGPVLPMPSNLWKADAGLLPASGNYLHIQRITADSGGETLAFTATPKDALFKINANFNRLSFEVSGEQRWTGDIRTMRGLQRLRRGHYGLPASQIDPVLSSLSMMGPLASSCTDAAAWFAIDQIAYTDEVLQAIEMRFERQCAGAKGLVRGQLRWQASDRSAAAGPQNPPPADLWRAPDGQPASSYLYLETENGLHFLYQNQGRTSLSVGVMGEDTILLGVGGTALLSGTIRGLLRQPLQTGYYANVGSIALQNPTRGAIELSGISCKDPRNWFVIDRLVRRDGQLQELDLRFEQQCPGRLATKGQLHWRP